jgi:hypothetical protein
MNGLATFTKSARDLSKTPLGIIALFIVLVYGLAALVVGFSKLPPNEVLPLIWFLVAFPVLVVMLFGWLVSHHHTRLYHPMDIPAEMRESWVHPQAPMMTPAPLAAGVKKRPKKSTKKIRALRLS